MASDRFGGDFFIVDNSISGWTAERYLEKWADLSTSFDVATGIFEIGSLLGLDGKWQQLGKIRILMGSETTHRTRQLLVQTLQNKSTVDLDRSIEEEKEENPFLNGVPAIVAALKSGQIECRIYTKNKFHAKAFITHAKNDVIGSQALVGSSNFTRPGLSKNVELNVRVEGRGDVVQLQQWFDEYWEESEEITEEILTVITRHTREYTPFDVYGKALQEYFRRHDLSAGDWEETRSKMFPYLDRYQKEAYWNLLNIANRHDGAFLCDGVGLGKTFVGLMLIEHLILHAGKRVMLLAPKGARESVWEPHLKQYLPHIGGAGTEHAFSNLQVFNHTDLSRGGDFPDSFQGMAELADVVIIDEAHHFRNPGQRGNNEGTRGPSRYYRLFDMLDPSIRKKQLYMFTATPINNQLADFRHMAELFTRRKESHFAQTVGVNSLRGHFNNLERELRSQIGETGGVSENLVETQEILETSTLFREIVVQRSRSYAKESQIRETGNAASFPNREDPRVAEYSIRKTFGKLLNLVDLAFQRENPLFTLAPYYPLHWYRGGDKEIDPLEEGRQKEVVSLIRTQFLKRFESSVTAFEISCDRLIKKLLAFLEVHSETQLERQRLVEWKTNNQEMLGYASQRQLDFWSESTEDQEDDDIIPAGLLETAEENRLLPTDYNISEMMNETFEDLDQMVLFLVEAKKFKPKQDDKLQKLLTLLRSKELSNQKVLIFTEFADTARYLAQQLLKSGMQGVEQIDSANASSNARLDTIKRFSPYYNGSSSDELVTNGQKEIRVLISTDILSEGINLQDAVRVINYDIHWNPVRLMQRIGRVDRRANQNIEARLKADHPEIAPHRGQIQIWNFLPPEELNDILTLYTRVTEKTLLISKTLGIEGRKLFRPEDDYDALREFNENYEGRRTAEEDMLLEYQSLLKNDPRLESRLRVFPGGIFSGRKKVKDKTSGIFFCYSLPALDKEMGEFTVDAGVTRWYFYDIESDSLEEDAGRIIDNIRSRVDTPRECVMEQVTLKEIRRKVLNYIENTYLKTVRAPVGVKPILRCWMELNEA